MPLVVRPTKSVELEEVKMVQELRGVLKRHDVNGDGRLSREELKEAFKELGSRYPSWRRWRATAYADGNGDGYIDWNELDNLIDHCVKHGLVPAVK